uniref:Chemosensory protein n=1 Tax=Cnaphalocrocis medinalis TaxID=437488 RepID=A0A0A1CN97_CNAME|nr:chemosensory protein [Cnaphalocrocis medinalis]
MKILAVTLVLTTCVTINTADESTYTTKYDGVDINEVLGNERLLTSYVNCLLDLGPCTPDGKELKNNLPDAIQNDCKKCSDRQREGADQVMDYIIDHRAEDWAKLEKKYNSDGSYKKKYLERKQAKEAKEAKESKEHDESQEKTE